MYIDPKGARMVLQNVCKDDIHEKLSTPWVARHWGRTYLMASDGSQLVAHVADGPWEGGDSRVLISGERWAPLANDLPVIDWRAVVPEPWAPECRLEVTIDNPDRFAVFPGDQKCRWAFSIGHVDGLVLRPMDSRSGRVHVMPRRLARAIPGGTGSRDLELRFSGRFDPVLVLPRYDPNDRIYPRWWSIVMPVRWS